MFFPCFRVSQKRNIKRSPNELKIYGDFLWTRRSPRSKRVGPEESRGDEKGGRRAHPPRKRPLPCRCLMVPPYFKLTPKIPINPETPRKKPRSGVPLPQDSVAKKNQSGARSASCWRGNPSPVAIFIIPVLSMTRRE